VFEILGTTISAAKEFSTHNISNFNEICEDAPGVQYFSVGGKKSGSTITKILQNGHNVIVNKVYGIECDGLIQDKEARWGNYLMTFENDHLEMMGFKPDHNPAGVYNLVADTVRVAEIKNDPELAYKYGLDKL
jgi:hypothetical protein